MAAELYSLGEYCDLENFHVMPVLISRLQKIKLTDVPAVSI